MRLLLRTLAASLLFTSISHATNDALATHQDALDAELLWGTYRPNLYFGTRPRLPNSLLTGLMWFGLDDPSGWNNIRHTCEMSDNMERYGYTRHNGRDFAEQTMKDPDQNVQIKTEFVKISGSGNDRSGGSWAVRVTGKTLKQDTEGLSLIYYFGLEDSNSTMQMSVNGKEARVAGAVHGIGEFAARIIPDPKNTTPQVPKVHQSVKGVKTGMRISGVGVTVPHEDVWKAKDAFVEKLVASAKKRIAILKESSDPETPLAASSVFSLPNSGLKKPQNLYFAQMVVAGDFSFDVIFNGPDNSSHIDQHALGAMISNKRKEFDARFESTFGLAEKGYTEAQTAMARSALSSLLGGVGYFYGRSLNSPSAKPEYGEDEEPKPGQLTEPYSLFAAAPSRPFFPRGFLWDEGFQQLVVGEWDNDLSMEIIKSWYEAMDDDGWIAREQILGPEARSKVPEEFQVQYPNFANPPTLLFAVSAFLRRAEAARSLLKAASGLSELTSPATSVLLADKELAAAWTAKVYPLVSRQFRWFVRTQSGELARFNHRARNAGGFRWRGRTANHTLTSGLDDYPRAFPPNAGELHVDLHAWMAFMARTLSELADSAGDHSGAAEFEQEYSQLLENLDDLHWSKEHSMFCDRTAEANPDFDELEDEEEDEMASREFCAKGYVSLIPFALGLVPRDSPKLASIFALAEELLGEAGIRSLAESDANYGKGENYWRGPVWINVNYMVLKALNVYYMGDGPYKDRAEGLYKKLRERIVRTVFEQYEETGFFWEQYDPATGRGQRTHPFTGWTTLVTLIMAEIY